MFALINFIFILMNHLFLEMDLLSFFHPCLINSLDVGIFFSVGVNKFFIPFFPFGPTICLIAQSLLIFVLPHISTSFFSYLESFSTYLVNKGILFFLEVYSVISEQHKKLYCDIM